MYGLFGVMIGIIVVFVALAYIAAITDNDDDDE